MKWLASADDVTFAGFGGQLLKWDSNTLLLKADLLLTELLVLLLLLLLKVSKLLFISRLLVLLVVLLFFELYSTVLSFSFNVSWNLDGCVKRAHLEMG